jgi:hypothetical protein
LVARKGLAKCLSFRIKQDREFISVNRFPVND